MTLRGWLLSGSFDRPTRTRLGCFFQLKCAACETRRQHVNVAAVLWATDKI